MASPKLNKFFNLELPKWPGMIVHGKSVTEEQALEILIRTDGLSLSCNDDDAIVEFGEIIYGIKIFREGWSSIENSVAFHLGLKKNEEDRWQKIGQFTDEIKQSLGALDLYYLENERIVSSWIGGAKGWCHWDGSIGSSNYNIGKWPSVKEVYYEWLQVAEAFPFLDLRCQLLNHEHNCIEWVRDDIPGPIVEYVIKDGKVEMKFPEDILPHSRELDGEMNFRNEVGVDASTLKRAVKITKKKMKTNV